VTRARARALLAGALAAAMLSACGSEPKLPAPEPGKAFDLRLVSGKVRVAPTGRNAFGLKGTSRVPAGAQVDATGGVVEITATRPGGASQHAEISGGRFALGAQAGGATTELTLIGGAACSPQSKTPRHEFRHLFGDGHGNFTTRGRFGAATVRGTRWGVRDQCGDTEIIARRGTVEATEFATGRRVTLRAPARFLARPG
jgi:hypothetical protein